MSPTTLRALLPILAASLVLAPTPAPAKGTTSPATIEIRLGVIAYEDSPGMVDLYRRLFKDLSAAQGSAGRPRLEARIALGNYGEVRSWVEKGLVDLAVLTPAVYAESLAARRRSDRPGRPACSYLATEGLGPAPRDSSWVTPERKKEGYHRFARSVCLVRKGSQLTRFDQVKKAAGLGLVEFLFVDPLSATGCVAPSWALKQGGILLSWRDEKPEGAVVTENFRYTFSHTRSLALLAEQRSKDMVDLKRAKPVGRERVAFVWDGVTAEDASLFEKVSFPQLDACAIPLNVWVARPHYEHTELIRRLLLKHNDDKERNDFRFDSDQERKRSYLDEVGRWSREVGAGADRPVSLDEIRRLIDGYRDRYGGHRVALVLSGGGAKCSYQAGALHEVEEQLGDSLALVVGTSGGALNALPVAQGVTRKNADLLAAVWTTTDLKDLARPGPPARILIGLWLACTCLILFAGLVRVARRIAAAGGFWGLPRRAILVVVFLALLAVLLAVLAWPLLVPWGWPGDSTEIVYTQLVLSWGGWLPAAVVAVVAVVWLAGLRWGWLAAATDAVERRPRLVWWVLAAGFVLLPLACLGTLLFASETLFDGTGMDKVVIRQYLKLIGRTDPVPDDRGEREELKKQLGEEVLAEGLVRDLVVTGSFLSRQRRTENPDLYFYLAAGNRKERKERLEKNPPRFGEHGVSLEEHSGILLHAVIGSGTQYPALPSHTAPDYPSKGRSIQLIDGGFAHNSPIEAAVQWGATHLILLEASPEAERPGGNSHLLKNLNIAFGHLFDQAQLLDARSREKVVIFTLRPSRSYLSGMDFISSMTGRAVANGRKEAAGRNFRRQHGMPRFLEEGSESRAP
jgi:predicted acylesterase/phospholipase RssA